MKKQKRKKYNEALSVQWIIKKTVIGGKPKVLGKKIKLKCVNR